MNFTEILTIILIFALAIALYFLPFIIAKRKRSERSTQVFLLNFFLGWSFVGWVIALIIAVGKKEKI